jgi:hypothetical protein
LPTEEGQTTKEGGEPGSKGREKLEGDRLSVAHFFLRNGTKNVLKEGRLTASDEILINRTDYSQQNFDLQFHENLSFLQISKSQMFFREQNKTSDEVDLPMIRNESAFFKFRTESQSVKLYETHP